VSFISAVLDAAITIAPYAVDQLKGWQQMSKPKIYGSSKPLPIKKKKGKKAPWQK
jgi:hypothetical protein